MKRNFLKACRTCASAAIIVISFLLLSSSIKQPNDQDDPESAPPASYCIDMGKLKQFMLDSLDSKDFEGGIYIKKDLIHSIEMLPPDSVYSFEGGVFRKSELINSIQLLPDDSVYILKVLANCNVAEGACLAITSRGYNLPVEMVASRSYKTSSSHPCHPCPRNACCFITIGIRHK